jgi:uncharacterized SAM-binding protein YcdF (DUF218 family)
VIPLDEIAKLFVPGTASCLVMVLLVGLGLVCAPRPFPRAGRALLAGTVVLYALLSTSPVHSALEQGLDVDVGSIRSAADAPSVGAVVVIGNGVTTHLHGGTFVDEMKRETTANVTEGARLFSLLGHPLVVVSGGIADPASQARTEADMMREALVAAGVSADRVVLEARSRNTYEQVVETSRLLRERQVDRFVVVTAPTHMKRVVSVFRRQGREPIPSVPLAGLERPHATGWAFSLGILDASRDLSYEYMALAWYWLRGRI